MSRSGDVPPASFRVPRDLGLRATALSHGWHETPPFRWDDDELALWIAHRLHAGQAVRLVRLTQPRGPGQPIHIDVDGVPASGEDLRAATGVAATWLNAGDDVSDFLERARGDAALAALVPMGGGRWLRGASLLEDVVKGICGTNTTWRQAVRSIRAIADLGEPAPGEGGAQMRAWPEPERIAAAGVAYLKEVARVGYRAESIRAVVEGVLDGSKNLQDLDQRAAAGMDAAGLARELTAIRGIGPATAHYLMSMRGYTRVPSVDSSTFGFTARAHFEGRRPTVAEIHALYAPYGPHAGRASWFEMYLNGYGASPYRVVPVPREGREGFEWFNRGAFFEAHEAWESVWRHLGGRPREAWHALIHLAVAAAHIDRGNAYGARHQADKARRRWERAKSGPLPFDVQAVDEALREVDRVARALASDPEAARTLVMPRI